jgi:hypothetical protein
VSAGSTAHHHRAAYALMVTGLVTLVVVVGGLIYGPLTGYHKLLVRSLEVQACDASSTRGERLIFFLPLI